MATTVAAVSTITPWMRTPEEIVRELQPTPAVTAARPCPEAKHVWTSLAQTPAEVIAQAFEEAVRRDPQRTKQWVALVDGNPTQLSLLCAAAAAYGVALCLVLDLIHVLQDLWKAAWALHLMTEEQCTPVAQCAHDLLKYADFLPDDA